VPLAGVVMIVPRLARRLDVAQLFSPGQMDAIRAWVKADRDLQQLYASCEPKDPTRVLIEIDGKTEVVELTRLIVQGNAMVSARRVKLDAVA